MKQNMENTKELVKIDNSHSLLSDFEHLYNERILSDVCLVVRGREFPTHRIILSASSDVFQVMLMNPQWSECREARVELCEPPECLDTFDDFIRYFYTGQIVLSLDTLMPVLVLADKYNVRHLIAVCLNYIESHTAKAASAGILVSWLQYTQYCGHDAVAQVCRNFVTWNLEFIAESCVLTSFDQQCIISFLKQSDLVVHDEMTLYRYVVKWLDAQAVNMAEAEMEELVVNVLSHIRFPMLTPRQLADLVLCPISSKYKEFLFTRLAIGMAFHKGKAGGMATFFDSEDGARLITPRLYTANTHASLLTIERLPILPRYHTSTLVFSSHMSLAEHEGDHTIEWVVDVYPKGVWIEKCYLIVWEGKMEVPRHSRDIVRLSITCKQASGNVRVKIGILVYGYQDGIECVLSVNERNHQFTEGDRVLQIDELIPFSMLNTDDREPPSKYLVGESRDVLKMHVVIEPLTLLTDKHNER